MAVKRLKVLWVIKSVLWQLFIMMLLFTLLVLQFHLLVNCTHGEGAIMDDLDMDAVRITKCQH